MDQFSTQQHIQALSMRNKEQFAERMTAAAPVVEELAKVQPSTWRDMRGLFTSMALVGGMNMLGNFTGRMKQAAMLPMNVLTNRLGFMLESVMMPLMPIVNKATMAYESFVMDNQAGALIGGGIGLLVGFAIPGGPLLWGIIGAGIGAGIQAWIRSGTRSYGEGERFPIGLTELYPEIFGEDYYEGSNIVQDPTGGGSPGSRPSLPDGRVIRVI